MAEKTSGQKAAQNQGGRDTMTDILKCTLGKVVLALTIIAFISSPIIGMTMATQVSKDAKATAEKALDLAESNSRDFAFFKGEVNAKLDYITKSQDRIIDFISNIERAE